MAAANKDPEDEPPLEVVAVLYSDKTAGVCAHPRAACCRPGTHAARLVGGDPRAPLLPQPSPPPLLPMLVAPGKDWSMDTDWEDAPAHVQRGYIAMLAIDSLLSFMGRCALWNEWRMVWQPGPAAQPGGGMLYASSPCGPHVGVYLSK